LWTRKTRATNRKMGNLFGTTISSNRLEIEITGDSYNKVFGKGALVGGSVVSLLVVVACYYFGSGIVNFGRRMIDGDPGIIQEDKKKKKKSKDI
jgi:hypothetical protein